MCVSRIRELQSLSEIRSLAFDVIEVIGHINGGEANEVVEVIEQGCSDEVYVGHVRHVRRLLSRMKALLTGVAVEGVQGVGPGVGAVA